MSHLSYHLLWLPRVKNLTRRSVLKEDAFPWEAVPVCFYMTFFCLLLILQKEEKPREKEKGKSRNIDHFMEELKHEQEMRERRNQEREHWRDARHGDNSAVRSFTDTVHEVEILGLTVKLSGLFMK